MQDPDDLQDLPNFEPLTPEEEVIEALADNNPGRAAELLRTMDVAGPVLLDALADMLDGDAKLDPGLAETYPYCLKLASWGIRGRKPKGSRAKGKSDPDYDPKRKPRHSDEFLARRVQRQIDNGMSREEAIRHVAERPDDIERDDTDKLQSLSFSTVEKAYDKYRKRRRKAAKPSK